MLQTSEPALLSLARILLSLIDKVSSGSALLPWLKEQYEKVQAALIRGSE